MWTYMVYFSDNKSIKIFVQPEEFKFDIVLCPWSVFVITY